MFTRREMLAASFSILGSTVLPKISKSETLPIDNADKTCKIFQTVRCKQKMYEICDYWQSKCSYPLFRTEKNNIVNRFPSVPMFPAENHNIEDIAWHTLIAAGVKHTKYPQTDALEFLCKSATDVFVDSKSYKYFKWIYQDSPFNIHEVNLEKYSDFYTNSMQQKFGKYTNQIFIACDLKDKNSNIIVKFDGYLGCCIFEDNKIFVGQI